MSSHRKALLQALFVTFLWSTSWVFIKIGLDDNDIPPLTFAGLRYTLAFGILLAVAWRRGGLAPIRQLSRRQWSILALLGVVYYTLTQGTQFLALDELPAITFSLMLNFSAVVVALAGIPLLKEYPGRSQWLGIGVFVAGVLIYFHPFDFPEATVLGMAIGVASVLANSGGALLGRSVNRELALPALTVTLVSMGIGSTIMLAAGVATEGIPTLSLTAWAIVIWLAVVNTAFAFTLWNHTLRTLSAVESSVINNTMLVQIAILAWIFLGETISAVELVGLALATVGIFMVSVRWGGKI